ncbi:MAG: leucyl aminopeptidase family protein [Aeropyrum sp.]|nr:leucyl aminopeptidase family protein [Aeropyrum sp.]MCE4616598.1 leucyl aminopeptidase family protein [Aeropyrum sp.]
MVLYTSPPSIGTLEGEPFSPGKPVVIPVFKEDNNGHSLPEGLPEDVSSLLQNALSMGIASPEPGRVASVPAKEYPILIAGCGSRGDLEGIRRGFAAAARQVLEKFEDLVLYLKGLSSVEASEAITATSLALYRLEKFKNTPRRKTKRILVYGSNTDLNAIMAVVEGVYLARDIANAPPHSLSPPILADRIKEVFSGLDSVEVEIYTYERLVKDGFGGIVNVGRGSDQKPRLIIIKYRGRGGRPVALVGKTVVFDSGGINLKPSQGMTLMRADKAGGAAVLGIVWAAAKLKLPISIVALIPAVINVPSGSSYLPSDVIRMWDGTMVEITNTDAEGRLILADAIAYAAKELDADPIIDLATLTGAMVVALGPLVAGFFSRDDYLSKILEESAQEVGEKLWRMPLVDDYKKSLTQPAQAGEIVNSAQRYGGAIFAALFLERFSHGKRLVHIDIAGPGIAFEAGSLAPPYWPEKGMAPGYGVRLIIRVLEKIAGDRG